MSRNYPEYRKFLQQQIQKLKSDASSTMAGFSMLNQAALADGVLSKQDKERIALGIAIAIRCEGCIAFHVKAALNAGNSRDQLLETIGVAVLMGGGPAMVYGCEALAAIDQFLD